MECRVCSKRFGSGRALGGHMRSHYTILPVPPKTQKLSVTLSSAQSPVCAEDSAVLDCESETESKSMHPSGLRGDKKRRSGIRTDFDKLGKMKDKKKSKKRRSNEPVTEFDQQVSSVSETTSDEDLAMCLLLLSRDKRVSTKAIPVEKKEQKLEETGVDDDLVADEKNHECPVCYKVFRSGQALGGHKRCHLLTSTTTTTTTTTTNTDPVAHPSLASNVWLIDLNLPAPLEDVEELSHSRVPVIC